MAISPQKVYLTYYDIQVIVNMYLDGSDVANIARGYKVSSARIVTILREMDVYHRRPLNSDLSERNIHIINMFRRGIPMSQIADHYKLTRQWVYMLIKKSVPELPNKDDQKSKRYEEVA
jgi:Mor family transcriptional regulator